MDATKRGEIARNGAVRIKSNQNQNQIKNQKSNPKQDFKLKPISNTFSGYLRVNLLWYLSC